MPTRLRKKGQVSVEYLVILVFIVGFIVAVVIPAVKEAELSIALASARSAVASFEAENPGFFVASLNYSIDQDTVFVRPAVYSRASGSMQQMPDALAQKIVSAIKTSVAREANASCATATNYVYCIQAA